MRFAWFPLIVACGGDPVPVDDEGPTPVPLLPVDTGGAASTTTEATEAGCVGTMRWLTVGELTDVWTAPTGDVVAVGPGGPLRRAAGDVAEWVPDGRWSAAAGVEWVVDGPDEGDGTDGVWAVSTEGVLRRGAEGWAPYTPADWPDDGAFAVEAFGGDEVAVVHLSDDGVQSTLAWWRFDGAELVPDGTDTLDGAGAVVAWLDAERPVVGTDQGTFLRSGEDWLPLDARMGCIDTAPDGTIAGCGGRERLFVIPPGAGVTSVDTEGFSELADVTEWVAVHAVRRDDVWMVGREVPRGAGVAEERVVVVRWEGDDEELTVLRPPSFGQQARALDGGDTGVWLVGGTVGRLAVEVDDVGVVVELDTRGAPGAVHTVAIDDVREEVVGLTETDTAAVWRDETWRGSADLPDELKGVVGAPMAASGGRVVVAGDDGALVTWGIGGFGRNTVGSTTWTHAAAADGTLFVARRDEVRRSGDADWAAVDPAGLLADLAIDQLWADTPDALVAAVRGDGGAWLIAWDGEAWSVASELPRPAVALARGGDEALWATLDDGSVHTWDGASLREVAAAHAERVAAVGSADGSWVAAHRSDDGGWVADADGAPLTPVDPTGVVWAARGDALHVALPHLGAVWQRVCAP